MKEALRAALRARIVAPSTVERRRAWHRFERALDRHLAARAAIRPAGRRA